MNGAQLRYICFGATDAMLFQMELLDDKRVGNIFEPSFFLICEKYIFLSILYAVLFLYFAFVRLPLKTFCSFFILCHCLC